MKRLFFVRAKKLRMNISRDGQRKAMGDPTCVRITQHGLGRSSTAWQCAEAHLALNVLGLIAGRTRWRRRGGRCYRCDCVATKVVLGHLGEGFPHSLVVSLELLDCFFDCRDEALFAITGHLGVHAIALASDKNKKNAGIRVLLDK